MRSSWTRCVPPSAGGGGGSLLGHRVGGRVHSPDAVLEDEPRVAGQRRGILPALPEDGLDVVHGRSTDGGLDVVPRWVVAVLLRQVFLRLGIAAVVCVVATRVAQVDPADVGDVAGRIVAVPDHDHLLVVRAAPADPHVEECLGAALLERAPEVEVLAGGEAERILVRTPDQAAYVDAALVGASEDLGDLAARLAGEPLVRIALPVGEEDQVAGSGGLDPFVQLGEVRRPVDQRPDQVALGPRLLVRVCFVETGPGIAALLLREQPVGKVDSWRRHAPTLPQEAPFVVRRSRRRSARRAARTVRGGPSPPGRSARGRRPRRR